MVKNKNTLLLYVIIIINLLFSAGCIREDIPECEQPEPERVPIRLKTAIVSRAAMDEFSETLVCIAQSTATGEYGEVWDATASGSEIRFSPERYYPADSSLIYLSGYYPAAPLTNGRVEFKLDGQTDVMAAKVQAGSLTSPFDKMAETFSFRHLLSLLKFSVQLEKQCPETYYLKHLSLDGSTETAWLDLSDNRLQFDTKQKKLIVYEAEHSAGIEISAQKAFSGYLLVRPRADLTVDIILAKDDNTEHDLSYADLPVEFEGNGSEANVAYKIDIIIGSPDLPIDPDNPPPPQITLSIRAQVTGWNEVPGEDIDLTPSNK